MIKIDRWIRSFIILTIGLTSITASIAYGEIGQLSKSRYSDPKGYFIIVPPDGWQIQEFKDDPRGKVKFVRPSPAGTMLLIIGQNSNFQNLDDLLRDAEAATARLKQKYGATSTTEIISFNDIPAYRITIDIPGKLKQTQIQFILKGIHYTLTYGAPPSGYDELLPMAMASFKTFDPVLKNVSQEEATKHVCASKMRLASMLIQLGQKQYAKEVIDEGLSLDPRHQGLLELKDSLLAK